MNRKVIATLSFCIAIGLHSIAWSTPYASSVIESGGSASFILNEAADNVTINRTGEANLDLGTLSAGTHNFALGSATAYDIVVSDSSSVGWTQTSNDSNNNLLSFDFVPGIAVNKNPASEAFGRVYVSNAVADTTAQGRSVGEGIYILGADGSDILGNGDTASTYGFAFANDAFGDIASPFRLQIDPLDILYISDWSDPNGSIYRTDADVSLASGKLVLAGIGDSANPNVHGSIASSAIIEGSLATGDLKIYALDEDLGPAQALFRWDIGSGPLPHNSAPTLVASPLLNFPGVQVDLDRGPDGKFYMMQTRFNGFFPGLVVVDSSGTTLYDSFDDSTVNFGEESDILKNSYSIEVSPDGSNIALSLRDGDTLMVPLINGLPDLANRELIDTHADGPSWNVSWDAAGNLYSHSEVTDLLRIFSPGGNSVATTSSAGTFDVVTTIPSFTTDFDGDGDVDADDLAQWDSDFGLNADSDADMDGDSDGADFLAWQRQLGSGTLIGAVTVPEPGAILLMLFGAILWLPSSRR